MCEQCEPVRRIIRKPKADRLRSLFGEYRPAWEALGKYLEAGVIELYAGDGPWETIWDYFDTSWESSIVMHYFRCRTCGQFYVSGLFAKGEPMLDVIELPAAERLARLWGKEGSYFNGK